LVLCIYYSNNRFREQEIREFILIPVVLIEVKRF
jgi:hypothetical protein